MIHFDIAGVILLSASFFCAITDLVKGKIYNVVTFPIMVVGILYHFLINGPEGIVFSLFGIGVALLLFFPLFAFKIMGAGDVKLLMAIGALEGWKFTVSVAVLSFLAGGIIGVLLLIYHGRFFKTVKTIGRLLLSLVVPQLEVEAPKLQDCFMAPFGVPILIGVILTYFQWVYFFANV